MATDLAPLTGTVGGGFLVGFITAYAIKKVIKLVAVIVGLFFAALVSCWSRYIWTIKFGNTDNC